MKLFNVIVLFLVACCVTVCGSHLPEDKPDDGVELIREKRDNFIDRILKSIPFFHMGSPTNVLEEEPIEQFNDDDDDDDDDEQTTTSSPLLSSTTIRASYVAASVSSSAMRPGIAPNTTAAYSNQSSYAMPNSTSIPLTTDSTTSTPLLATTQAMNTTLPALNSILMTASYAEDKWSMSPTATVASDAIVNSSVYSYPYSASILSTPSVSIAPSSISKMDTTASAGGKDDSEPVIKMMIMSGESPMRVQEYGARLPDERGYADGAGRQQIGEDIDVKNIRFMYASVLVPVMSGLVGALLITFGILIFKCIKRKKLKRVRYYGAKPGSGLYRLDQIGLLSDMSSDEE